MVDRGVKPTEMLERITEQLMPPFHELFRVSIILKLKATGPFKRQPDEESGLAGVQLTTGNRVLDMVSALQGVERKSNVRAFHRARYDGYHTYPA